MIEAIFVQINRERVGTFVLGTEGGYRDMAMIQDCDTAVSRICDMCGWAEDLKKLVLQGDAPHKHKAKTTTNHTTTCTTKPKEVKQNIPVTNQHQRTSQTIHIGQKEQQNNK